MSRRPLLALAAASSIGALVLALAPSGSTSAATSECPAGSFRGDTTLQDFADGKTGSCQQAKGIESFAELSKANASITMRQRSGALGDVSSVAYPAGARQAAALKASGIASPTSTWSQYQKTPLLADQPGYGSVNGLGLADLSGRIEDLAYVSPGSQRWFAAVANGGVYETLDEGASWHSIGDNLPTQITGALAWTRAGGGTLLVGTGDPAFGGSSFSGLGAYWTNDAGKTWTKSTGVPDGTISFSAAVDPSNPSRIYLATGKGLYRSVDAGRSFVNVVLPTTCTDVAKRTCFFANIVTDVVVRAADASGGGGKVLAVVGWRAGTKLNAQGSPQSPRNGIYTSDTGAKGSFSYLGAPAGFPAQARIGRTSLGIANGPDQNHDYVFAVVQDADKFNKARTADGGVPEPDALASNVPGNTVLNGIYASPDFGKNWTKLADSVQLSAPGSGTALVGANSVSYAPGVQSWYNSWIQVDPTSGSDVSGAPARIAFGLEEVWTNVSPLVISPVGSPVDPPADAPQGTTQFQVIGRYFGGTSCLGLNTNALIPGGSPYCPANGVDTTAGPTTTTHPDQHAGMFVPKGEGVTLVVGNDGGAYAQTVGSGGRFSNTQWKRGNNVGFDDLLPYDAAMAKDGTVWMGLQDNGTAKIEKSGKTIETYGGDGFYVAVDPDDSRIAWEEYTGGQIRVTRDGGKTWTTNNPTMTGALFATPFKMDPTDADHLVIGGREIFETTHGPGTTSSTWKKVYDLGTRTQPGNAGASTGTGNPNNAQSAIDVRGDNIYVGYCGYCDIVTGGVPFGSGIATNVGGWHIAAAKGLPKRYVTSVTIDPKDPKTVYVTLGGYGRRWIPPGSLGDDLSKVGVGHVFKSTNAGASFTDVSGDLPDLPANHVLPYQGKLIVSTDLGVFVSKTTNGGSYHQLGRGLPAVPSFEVSVAPQNSTLLVATTYGRSVWTTTAGDLDKVVDAATPVAPTTPGKGTGGGEHLASSGGAPAVAVLALLLLTVGVAVRRRA
ncbi:MAG: hypothetical protein QOJ48_315 [Frankiales bacterium]|nr:hypothetical protein [Frankiales bacterium]